MLIKFLLHGKEVDLTGDNVTIKSTNFNVTKDGTVSCSNANITGGKINISTSRALGDQVFTVKDDLDRKSYLGATNACIGYTGNDTSTGVLISGSSAGGGETWVTADHFSQTSLEKNKTNIEKLENGLEIIKKVDIYKYNLKRQENKTKKHIGFVIGKDYKYSSEITSVDENGKETGVELYSMIAVAYKAIQEQQKQIEELTKKLEKKEATNGNT